MITQKLLHEVLDFSQETGDFFWKKRVAQHIDAGSKAGTLKKEGYVQICIKNKLYLAHRLAWIYAHGKIPKGMEIDHINRVKNDNRISNLRLATKTQNRFNSDFRGSNKNGFVGVHASGKNWVSRIKINKKILHLGTFPTKKDAANAYLSAAKNHHKEFFSSVYA